MKKHLLIFIFLLGYFASFSQNAPTVYVDIQAPLAICNPGESTTLQADYLQTYATNTNNYNVTSIPYAPQYPFSDPTATKLNVTIDDIWSPIVDLPFPFCFYGQNYTKLLVGANGVITFDIAGVVPGGTENPMIAGDCDWSFTSSIPNTNSDFTIRNAIYGVYQDIHPGLVTDPVVQNINYRVHGTAPNRAFVLTTSEIPQFSCNTSVGLQTYQIILYETTNTIDVLVNKRTPCNSWQNGVGVIGVMNKAGTLASVPPGRNTGNWSAFNEAWRFTPSAAGGSNVTLEWFQGATSLGSTNPLTVSPTTPTTYTAVATYTRCDGSLIQIQDDITVSVEPSLPTLNPQDVTICTSSPGPYTFNINQNAYMANGYTYNPTPTPDFIFRYFVDNAGAPGAQIPDATLNAYTPASSTYPQTIWVTVEEQGSVTGTGCTNLRSFQLNITAGPSGSFSYSAAYCESVTAPQPVTLNALTSGGVFSATPAGLIIDPSTGAITPNGSTPNTYTIHYDIAATGSCPAYSAPTFTVTINPAPTAPVVTVVQPTCTVTTGSITVTSPLGAGYEYSIDNGVTYQANPAFLSVPPGSYTVIVRDISSSCVSPTTPVTINTPPGSPAIPLINTSAATCTVDGSSTVVNYDATLTYTFTPVGPSVGAGGAISGMVVGTSYTVVASNATCSSAPSSSFSNDAMLTVPAVPTISSTPASCTSTELSSISNYDATLTYTFTPVGPSVGAGGTISGMVVGTSYTVVANNASCPSGSSVSFSNDAMLTVPAVPTISSTPASCTSNELSTIGNYDATLTYTFTPVGPSVGAGGAISGMVVGTSYTVVASNATCSSAPSSSFSNDAMLTVPAVPTISSTPASCTSTELSSISNYNATLTYTFTPVGPSVGAGGTISGMVVGTSYTVVANNASCPSGSSVSFSNDAMLTVPAVPTISSTPASCTSNELSTIGNYDATLTYTFTPVGPSVGAGGAISGMVVGTSYTVVASNATCSSAPSSSFSNDAMLTVPAVPTISSTPASCTSTELSSISNYNATLTYTFTPVGPSVGAGGTISGMVVGTSYTVVANNASCPSGSSVSFSNDAMLTVPAVPTISSTPASCTSNELSTVGNYDATLTYTFTPVGPSVGAGGAISGMVVGTSYTVVASNASCQSGASSSFSNDAMLTVPAVPTISSTPASCTSTELSSISNYNATLTYTFTPVGPSVGAGGTISGMVVGTSYTVVANNASCPSGSSVSFSNDAMLTVPAVPTISSTPASCTSNELSTVGNYDATLIYTFTPVGPSVGAGGAISGMVVGTSYTVVASNASCQSGASSPFSNDAMLATPAVPIITTTPATCTADGSSTITNYVAGQTYVFNPTGPIVGAGGVITGMTAGLNYTVLTNNGSCNSGASTQFSNPVKFTAPVVTLTNGFVCVDPISGAVLNSHTINTNLSAADYSFQWSDSSGAPVGTGSSYVATAPGTYTVVVTSLTTGCGSTAAQATVGTSSWPQALDVVTSEYFADVMSINVIATPAGNYEYSLDGGNFQSSNVFIDVAPGEHEVTVRDVNQCGDISITTTLIDYPRYFTPNGDGYHDTWNISALQGQSNSKIHIFDRFGKLLKEIRPSSSGWNGTFNGQDLPSTDYWFVVFYQEKGQNKEFKSHFSLKR